MHQRSTFLALRLPAALVAGLIALATTVRTSDAAGLPEAMPDVLARCELSGVTGPAGAEQVCITDPRLPRGRWLTIGIPEAGWLAESYDAQRRAVLLRVGGQTRWVALRGAAITALPMVQLADGRIDYAHMQLTDRQKEQKAALQMWELMEISRLGRLDEPPSSAPAAKSGDGGSGGASSSSQPR